MFSSSDFSSEMVDSYFDLRSSELFVSWDFRLAISRSFSAREFRKDSAVDFLVSSISLAFDSAARCRRDSSSRLNSVFRTWAWISA